MIIFNLWTGSEKQISYKINKSGFKVKSDIEKTDIDFVTSTNNEPHKQSTQELAGPIPAYEFVSPITL